MRVLQIHNEYRQQGGEDVVVSHEAELLREAGHHVVEHRVRNPEGNVSAARKLVVAPWNPASKSSVDDLLDSAKPDVAHVHNTWFNLTPSVVGALVEREIPIVMSLHNYRLMCLNGLLLRDGKTCRLCVGRSPLQGVRYRCYRGSLTASTAAAATLSLNRALETWDEVTTFLANSHFVRDTYMEAGLPAQKIMIKPNSAADPGPRAIPVEESDVVLYVGRISSEKGIDFLARLWRRFETGLTLRVIGDGPSRERLADRHPNIEFIGQQGADLVADQMRAARALLFPSTTYETCPLAIVEAFAAGLPVLANRRGAMREMVSMVDDEWLREPEDMESWMEGLALVEDDDRTAAAGKRARAAYESSFTPDLAVKRLEAAYETAVS